MEIVQLDTTPKNDVLEQLYSINQEHAHYLTDLKNKTELSKLIELSDFFLYVLDDINVLGFMMCFREKSKHLSLNYKYFNDRKEKFLYVDRIAIRSDNGRKGFGSLLYKELFKIAALSNLSVCCEVYTRPMNTTSLKFHYKNGFKSVGKYDFEKYSVEYLSK